MADEPGVKPLSDEDIADIKALFVAFDEAALAGEFDKMVGMMTEDTVLMSPNMPIIEGRTGISEFLKAFESATITEQKLNFLKSMVMVILPMLGVFTKKQLLLKVLLSQ